MDLEKQQAHILLAEMPTTSHRETDLLRELLVDGSDYRFLDAARYRMGFCGRYSNCPISHHI
jgi:hypothetical protein